MKDTFLLHEFVSHSAETRPDAPALTYQSAHLSYGALADSVNSFACALSALGVKRGERVAVYLEKRFENVIACFGASKAGCIFVPINPLLKPEQVAYILRDCNVKILVTSRDRQALLNEVLVACSDLTQIICVDDEQQWNTLLDQPALTWTA